MFSAPIVALWFPQLVPGPLLLLGCLLALLTVLASGTRRREWKAAELVMVGRMLGTALAAVCLISPRALRCRIRSREQRAIIRCGHFCPDSQALPRSSCS